MIIKHDYDIDFDDNRHINRKCWRLIDSNWLTYKEGTKMSDYYWALNSGRQWINSKETRKLERIENESLQEILERLRDDGD